MTRPTPPNGATLDETDHINETFQITTTEGQYEFSIATKAQFVTRDDLPPQIRVWGDDDFVKPVVLRTFNLDYVVDYGWAE